MSWARMRGMDRGYHSESSSAAQKKKKAEMMCIARAGARTTVGQGFSGWRDDDSYRYRYDERRTATGSGLRWTLVSIFLVAMNSKVRPSLASSLAILAFLVAFVPLSPALLAWSWGGLWHKYGSTFVLDNYGFHAFSGGWRRSRPSFDIGRSPQECHSFAPVLSFSPPSPSQLGTFQAFLGPLP